LDFQGCGRLLFRSGLRPRGVLLVVDVPRSALLFSVDLHFLDELAAMGADLKFRAI